MKSFPSRTALFPRAPSFGVSVALQTLLVFLAVVLLVGARTPTSFELFGLSGTAWFTLIPLGAAIAFLLIETTAHNEKLGSRTERLPIKTLLPFFLLTLYSASWLVIRPNFEGAQSLAALLAFVFVFIAGTAISLSPRAEWWKVPTIVALFAWPLFLTLSTYGSFDAGLTLLGRDRGQVLVLAIAIIPLLTKKLFVAFPLLLVLSLATVLSDSRFAALTAVFIGGMITLAILWRFSKRMAAFAATTWAITFVALSHWIQVVMGLRRTYGIAPLDWVEGLQSANRVAPSGSEINAFSFGRAEVWEGLIRSVDSTSGVFFGNGPGSAALLGREINPAFNHPHNEYLRMFVDTGIVGLLLLLTGCLGLLAMVFLKRQTLEVAPSLSFISLWFALVAHSFFSNPLLTPHFLIPTAFFLGYTLRITNPSV